VKLQHAEDMPLAVLKKVKRDPENNTGFKFYDEEESNSS
jgi:hypothetical protein